LISRFIFVILLCASQAAPATRAARIEKSIDRDWTFQYYPSPEPDLHPASEFFDDSAWPAIALPHTWSTFETTRDLHPFIKAATERDDSYWWYGWGWYRKRISIDARYSARLISLEFDGVQKYSQIFVNGKKAGEHKGGYTSFSIDITPLVRFIAINTIAVLVSNRRDDPNAIPPMTAGNFNVYGGIYRGVRLAVKDRLHIPYQGSADYEGGTFITTPKVSAQSAEALVRTWVRNDYSGPRECALETSVYDAAGKRIATGTARRTIAAGVTEEFSQTFAIGSPHLWSPDTPYVYRVHSEITGSGDAIDSPLGFRWFSWDHAAHRMYLNGAPIRLNGTNRHQEYPWLGDAIPTWMTRRDLEDIRLNLGHNFQRTAHYPNDPLVYDLSDRLGIITAEEVPNIKDIAFNRGVQKQNVTEMIRRDRNHPSIFFWSMGNETNQPADSVWGHAEDVTRLIHLRRGTNGGDFVQTDNDDIGFENLLRCTVRGWHDGDRDFNGNGHPKNGQVTGTEEWQHDTDRDEIAKRPNDNIVVFLYEDHGADRKYLFAPLFYVNPKGFVDAYRNPKYSYYLWEANFSAKPVLFIEPHNWRDKYVGTKRDIVVDSNCSAVTLRVNGRVFGTLKPDAGNAHSVTFSNVPVERGTLSAEAVRDGKPIRAEVMMAGAPDRIVLRASSQSIPAGRNGIATVSADVVDSAGVHVIGASPLLTWKVDGPGKLVGAPVYETDTLKNGSYTGTMYIDAPVSNVVRSGSAAGRITVRVESPGLKTGVVTIDSVERPDDKIPGIAEPALFDNERLRITRDANVKPAIFAARSHKLNEIAQDYNIPRSTGGYAVAISTFIEKRNIDADTSTASFHDLVTHLADLLTTTRGHLVADDYNFLIRQFNDKRIKK